MAKLRQNNEDAKVKYLVQRNGDEFLIEVPANWKVTFGYVNPSQPERGYDRQSAHCLRVYEGEKLRAVFGNVTGFRDLSIPLARKFQKETGSAEWSRDSEGSFERSERVDVESELVLEPAEDPFDTP